MGDERKPGTRVEFDASAAPAVDPRQMREAALHHTREWLETIALAGRAVQAEDVLLFAESYASQVAPVLGTVEETPEAVRERLRDVVRERAPELDVEGPIIGPMLDAFAGQVVELSAAAEALETPEPVCPNCGANRQDYCDSPEGSSTPDCGCGTAMPPAWRAGDDVYPNHEYEQAVEALRLKAWAGCKGCGRPVGKAHEPDCGFARSRVVNEMQTRIAPVETRGEGDGERRAAAAAPDLVSRMIDARDCLRGCNSFASAQNARAIEGALRWLDVGIEEGLAQRELYGDLRRLVAGEPHTCGCIAGCARVASTGCRFEAALRSLVGDA